MISASSSLAGGILSGSFGTPPTTIPTIAGGTTSSTYSPDYILAESRGGAAAGNVDAAFLSNLEFAQDTEALLLDPHSNGALTGTPTSYVQQIIKAITPGAPTSITTPATTASSTALPAEGILA